LAIKGQILSNFMQHFFIRTGDIPPYLTGSFVGDCMWTGRLRTTNTLSDTLKQQVKGIPELPSAASARAGLTSKSNFNHLILNKLCKQVRRGELSSLFWVDLPCLDD
jgi:hypothetical protein